MLEPAPRKDSPALGLVFGGGGAIGTAYLAGALKALQEAGLDLASPDLVIGTSAGALVATQIRLGASPDEILALADATPDETAPDRPGQHYERAWSTRSELARRVVGTSAVVARSWLHAPLPMPSARTEARFPGGLFRVRDRARLEAVIPVEWPEGALWLMAVDLATNRREALGRRPEHRLLPMRDAVLASCAVPGFYEPVHFNGRRYVDGGVRSTTSLDYAVNYGCERVICIAPMGYEPTARLTARHRTFRRPAVRAVRRELRRAGDRARDVLLLQPAGADLEVHGTNVFRSTGNADIAERARCQVRTVLRTDVGRRYVSG